MIPVLALTITAACAFAAGYLLCGIATWIRAHRQENQIRALANAIVEMKEMEGFVPTEWVVDQLDSMLAGSAFR